MATGYQVLARAGQLRAALQHMLDGGLSGANREIVEGMLNALLSAIERYDRSHGGSGSAPANDHILGLIDAALAVAHPGSIGALEERLDRVLDALNA